MFDFSAEGGLFGMDPWIRSRREQLAERMAQEELPALLELADSRELDTAEVEDVLCERIGEIMHRCDADGGTDPFQSDYIDPDRVLGALTSAVMDTLSAPAQVPEAADFQPGGSLFAAWRLWELLREITPEAETQALYEFEGVLRSRLAATVPASTVRSVVADSLRWACDAYGSRFLITVEFERAGRKRWYAWDVDACGFEARTVDAEFFDSPEPALESWRAVVGETAAGSAVLAPADTAESWNLITALLPEIETFGRMGGESAAQLREYHRSRRLARVLRDADRFPHSDPETEAGREVRAQRWAEQFMTWLSEHEPGGASAVDVKERAIELADTWAGDVPDQLFLTCSPHRVATKLQSIHGYYVEDFAAALQDLLPQWVRWIAQRTGLAGHLLERSLEYCDGRTHPAQASDESELNWYARCTE